MTEAMRRHSLWRMRWLLVLLAAVAAGVTVWHARSRAPRPLTPAERKAAQQELRGLLSTGPGYRSAAALIAESAQALGTHDLNDGITSRWAVRVASTVIAAEPSYAPAYDLLGKGLLEQAEFDKAAAAFRKARRLQHHDRTAANELRETARRARIARALPLALRPGQRLLSLFVVPSDPHGSVFVLIGRVKQYDEYERQILDREARLFVREGKRYREVLRTTDVGPAKEDEFTDYRVWSADMVGLGRPQVVLETGWAGADHTGGALDLFQPERGSEAHLAHVTGIVPGGGASFGFKDLDGDKRPEIITYKLLEYLYASGSVWRDVFKYDGHRYRLATSQFPDIVRENVDELEARQEFYRKEVGQEDETVAKYLARGRRYLRDSEKAPAPSRRQQR
jgi:hypothetical protein